MLKTLEKLFTISLDMYFLDQSHALLTYIMDAHAQINSYVNIAFLAEYVAIAGQVYLTYPTATVMAYSNIASFTIDLL